MSTRSTYETIADALRDSIEDGRLATGTVLLEGSIAAMFGSSRTPVRQALELLLRQGAVSRFEGRGLVVGDGSAPPDRRTLDRTDLVQLSGMAGKIPAWQSLYHDVERALIRASVLGCFRVNELELARHHGVGRTVGHDVLVRIQATGILAKDRQAHWITVPLDDQRVNDLYELREILEPVVLRIAAQHIPAAILGEMRVRLHEAARDYPNVTSQQLDRLEHDLHVACPAFAGNPELLAALARTRCIIISSKHILHHGEALPDRDPFLREHDRVLAALQQGNGDAAADALLTHLRAARRKVLRRLRTFRQSHRAPSPPYVGPTKSYLAEPTL